MSCRLGKWLRKGAQPRHSLHFSFSTLCHGPFVQQPSTSTRACSYRFSQETSVSPMSCLGGSELGKPASSSCIPSPYARYKVIEVERRCTYCICYGYLNKGTYPSECYKKCLPPAQGRHVSHSTGPRSTLLEVWPCLSKQCFILSLSLPISGCTLFVSTTQSREEVGWLPPQGWIIF